jgi:predicted Zn-dependent protease
MMLRLMQRLILVALLAMLAGCSSVLGPGVAVTQTGGQMAPLVSDTGDPADDIIGARENPKIIASYGGIYSDRPAEIMIAQIVGKLLSAADQPNTKFTVTILDSPVVNAFALPGGYIYVTRGILALANDQSELAAVLAHEISHVILKHAQARTNRIKTTALVDKVVTGVFGADPSTDQTANRAQLSLAAFSQAQELAADKEGIMISGKAGFDPHAAARFLGAMGRFAQYTQGDADQGADFLSSHPSTPDRIQKATEIARSFFGAPGIGVQNRPDYMAAIDDMVYGDSPQQGAIAGQRFIHPGLKFTFTVPDGYNLQISNGAVVGVAGDGEAVRFDSATVPDTMALTDYLKSGWIAGLQADSIRTQTVSGFDTASGVAKTDQWNFRVQVVRFSGKVYRFIFAARIDSELFARGADQTIKSFRAATAADLRQVHSLAIKTVTAGPVDTADSLARRMGGVSDATNLFYILNNLYPGDPVTPGAAYKVVVVN